MTLTQRHYLIYHGTFFAPTLYATVVIINLHMFILCISRGPASGHLVPYLYTSLFSDKVSGPARPADLCIVLHADVFILFVLLRVVLRSDDRASIEGSLSPGNC